MPELIKNSLSYETISQWDQKYDLIFLTLEAEVKGEIHSSFSEHRGCAFS